MADPEGIRLSLGRQRHASSSDIMLDAGEKARRVMDSSTASQHSTDEPHDLPPLVGAPSKVVSSRYASGEGGASETTLPASAAALSSLKTEDIESQGAGMMMAGHQGTRSNSLYETGQGSPSLRRRLKLLVRQKSEPDMLIGRSELGMNSPGLRRRMIAPSPPPMDSPRSHSGSECNSPRIIRKPKSLHGYCPGAVPSSPLTPRSVENSPRITRRSMSVTLHQSPGAPFTTTCDTAESPPKHVRSNSMGYDVPCTRADAPLSANPLGPGSPFTARRGIALRKLSVSRSNTPSMVDALPSLNGNNEGCVSQLVHPQDHRNFVQSCEDDARANKSFVSVETVQNSLHDHVAADDRFALALQGQHHPVRKPQQKPPSQLPSVHQENSYPVDHQQHHNPHHQSHRYAQHSPPHGHAFVERRLIADCSPPPANSPTREIGVALGSGSDTDNIHTGNNQESNLMKDSFTSSYSSGSATDQKSRMESEMSNEEASCRRHSNNLYDIDESREPAEDNMSDGFNGNPDQDERHVVTPVEEGEKSAFETPSCVDDERKGEGDKNIISEEQPPLHNDCDKNGNDAKKIEGDKEGVENRMEEELEEDDIEGEEGSEEEDDSYDEDVPEYQKAPMPTNMRIKNWLAGLADSDKGNSSRISSFFPEIT